MAFIQREIENTRVALRTKIEALFAQKSYELKAIMSAYQSSNPKDKIPKNSALLAKNGKPTELEDIGVGESFWLYSKETIARARLESKEKL